MLACINPQVQSTTQNYNEYKGKVRHDTIGHMVGLYITTEVAPSIWVAVVSLTEDQTCCNPVSKPTASEEQSSQ